MLAHSPLDKMVLSSNLAAGLQGRPAQHIVQHAVLNVVQHVGCGARLLWLSLQLSGGAQNSLICLLHVFRSALASAFCYHMVSKPALLLSATNVAHKTNPRDTGRTTRRASSRTSSGACWGRQKRCHMFTCVLHASSRARGCDLVLTWRSGRANFGLCRALGAGRYTGAQAQG